MDEPTVKSRYYKMSINIGPFSYFQNSRVYDIPEGQSTILPGLGYSIVTILLGWWGIKIRKPFENYRNSLEALHINFNGGEDITTLVTELDFDEKTIYVWRNILRKTSEKLKLAEVEMIIDIQHENIELGKKLYTEENVDYIIINLSKADIHRIDGDDIRDIFDALKNYEMNGKFA